MSTRAADRTVAANQRWFDRWPGRYESNPISQWLQEIQSQALAALDLGPEDRLLDVGTGTGVAVRRAATTVTEAVGIDVSPAMVAEARKLAAGLPNASFLQADSARLPFDDESFTAVLCSTSFHHYAEPGPAVLEMARVLKPKGRLVIADGNAERRIVQVIDRINRVVEPSHVRLYRLPEFSGFLHDAGLVEPQVRRLYNGAYVLVRATKP
jgi:ubiquinone/menaquinone biosynthesis C-methylase UbiE